MSRDPDDPPAWQVIGIVIAVILMCGAMGFGLLLLTRYAHARDGGNWTGEIPEIREWIKSVMRPDYPENSCCGEADLYEADLGEVADDGTVYAIITNSRGNPLPVGTKLVIPASKIQNRQGNPTGHVLVFASGMNVFCFVPNGAG
jgi:hypothetical protein